MRDKFCQNCERNFALLGCSKSREFYYSQLTSSSPCPEWQDGELEAIAEELKNQRQWLKKKGEPWTDANKRRWTEARRLFETGYRITLPVRKEEEDFSRYENICPLASMGIHRDGCSCRKRED